MHLLRDAWIPIRRQDGRDERIAPCQLTTDYATNPVQKLYAPRPDFTGALAQFLIGWLQTAAFVQELSVEKWDEFYQRPPSPQELEQYCAPLQRAFYFDHPDQPRFLQDYEDLSQPEKPDQPRQAKDQVDSKVISQLLIEQPGAQTIKRNGDHFVKNHGIQQLCYACSAMALLTLQMNAPSGGSGHRTSLRGGGPLTTLIVSDTDKMPETLWRQLWLNVLPSDELAHYWGIADTQVTETDWARIFPWLAPTRTSKKDQKTLATYPQQDAHVLQAYWGMPRRIRLDFDQTEVGQCDGCGLSAQKVLQRYYTKNYGINYTGSWVHPLSPYYISKKKKPPEGTVKDDLPLPMHAQPDGIGYKYWHDLVLAGHAAFPIRYLRSHRNPLLKKNLKIWTFGYDMDNMKARCWYETHTPFYQVGEAIQELTPLIKDNIEGAKKAQQYLVIALKKASTGSTAKIASSLLEAPKMQFWHDTEKKFYEILQQTITWLQENRQGESARVNAELERIKEEWLTYLQGAVETIFKEYVNTVYDQPLAIKKIVQAEINLKKNIAGKAMRTTLHLPVKERKKEQKDDYAKN